MKNALIVIAREGFQDIELDGVRKGLEDAGFALTIASTETGICTGKFGSQQEATLALRDAVVTNYDRIVFIGGPGAHALKDNFDALNVARTAALAKVLLGAICVAPTILAAAGVLKGRNATVWDENGEQKRFLMSRGATYTGASVTVDGLIVTGNGPEAAVDFGKKFAAL